MKLVNLLKAISISILIIMGFNVLSYEKANSEGISIDAGLTPAYKRLMFRSQVRYMHRDNHPTMDQMKMTSYMFPVVVAYGLRPDLTLIVRQVYMQRDMAGINSDGFGDLLIMSKYRLFRQNTADYVVGIAPTLGLELPTGNDGFTSNSYDLHLGTLLSARLKSLAADLNFKYVVNGMALSGGGDLVPGDEFSIQTAFAYRMGLGSSANLMFTPVLETSFMDIQSAENDGVKLPNSGESILLLSPGLKVTYGSLIFENLVQFPIWQEQNGIQTERDIGFLIGIRIMN